MARIAGQVKWIIPALPLLLAAWLPQRDSHVNDPPDRLSAFGFFTGDLAKLQPAEGVVPYELATPLFSNYAEKLRFIKLPAGMRAVYNDTAAFDLPVGTYLIKNFYYPLDFRQPELGRRLMETRVMFRDANGWQTWPYIWDAQQQDAEYDPAGETMRVQYINAQGRKVETDYLVPNKNQCKGCHVQGNDIVPIGIAARHLAAGAQGQAQLRQWADRGMLQGLPETGIPANADWTDAGASLDSRARAYLDINCGHCHHPAGPGATSGLFLHAAEASATALGIFKTPVAAGRGSGNRKYDIVPGKPDASILLFRMTTNDPGIAMPEIGREQVHAEGVALIREWIRRMPQ